MLSAEAASHGQQSNRERSNNVVDQGRGPEDGDNSRDGSRESSGKRKIADREPESPGKGEVESPYVKKERASYYGDMGEDSKSSYPKHVLVPADERAKDSKMEHPHEGRTSHDHHPNPVSFPLPDKPGNVLTPDSAGRGRSSAAYDPPMYQRHQPYQDVYRAPSYNPDMDYGRSGGYSGGSNHMHGPGSHASESYSQPPRRWACDYCNVATFLSYEEACAHEEACARRHLDHYQDPRSAPHPSAATYGGSHGGPPPPPPPHHHHHHHQGGVNGLGALYHASQEVVTPPTPHHHQASHWGSRGPPLPVLPHEQNYYRQDYYDRREDPVSYPPHHDPYAYPPPSHHHHHHGHAPAHQYYHKRMLLAMPSDKDSLSDRQCYVRSEMVEIFAATEKDVAARHSKGAQKLVLGQVGIRCVHCSHLRPRDRAERAVCYPSSISRIYQTVADMQRFHFEQCREIPDHVRQIYKKLKTTRPRGVGSPQTYWVSSAKTMGLVDTEGGIRFEQELSKEQYRQGSDMSVGTS